MVAGARKRRRFTLRPARCRRFRCRSRKVRHRSWGATTSEAGSRPTPRSLRICAPRPISRHCRVRASLGRGIAGFRDRHHRHARGAVAQQHQHTPALGLEARQRLMDRLGAAEHVGNDIGAVQPRQHVLAVADTAINERHVIDRIERRQKRIAGQACRFRIRPETRRPARSACRAPADRRSARRS